MKILKLANNQVTNAIATTYTNTKKGASYFNLEIGTVTGVSSKTWLWKAFLSRKHFKPSGENDTLELTSNDYNITPIHYNKSGVKKYLRDNRGNISYNIIRDSDTSHNNDILLLWELTNSNISNVNYTVSNGAIVIGKAYSGKDRGVSSYSIPSLVLEITGNCELSWTGTTKDNIPVKQVIKYNYIDKSWDITPYKEITDEVQ